MTDFGAIDQTPALQALMQKREIPSFKELSRRSGISEKQLRRLRRGEGAKLPLETFVKLAEALQVPVEEILAQFAGFEDTSASLRQEYQRLQEQINEQRQELTLEFQQESVSILESWLKNWSLVKYKVQGKAAIEPMTLIRLVQPVEKLIAHWGIEGLGEVGEEVIYDPQWHQLKKGEAEKGDRVKINRIGYRHQGKLLYRAEVEPF